MKKIIAICLAVVCVLSLAGCNAADNEKIEETVVGTYKSIESAVVGAYKSVESFFVNGFNTVSDKITALLFAEDGESIEEVKNRLESGNEEASK